MPITLFGERHHELPNVATVPQYSPFRYPGGKSRWYKFVKQWVLQTAPEVFVEPFAGGAHAGLAIAIENLAEKVVLVELDDNVAAVWKTILEGDADWLLERIEEFEMSRDAAEEAIQRSSDSVRDRAFAMIIHNRVSRGGVTAPGAGWLKNGENGKGLHSRWYPETLVDRITKIADAADRIEFIHGDGLEVMEAYQDRRDASLFIDPPYPKAGGRLYEHSDVDHREIFRKAVAAAGPVLLTYDDSDEVETLVREFGLEAEYLLVSTTHHREKKELLIGDDLGWLSGLQ
jgi:DNA adenine methylase